MIIIESVSAVPLSRVSAVSVKVLYSISGYTRSVAIIRAAASIISRLP